MDFKKLPNTIIIGAAKAGTTSLFDILKQHPQVYTPEKKELRFFSDDKHYERGVQWYEDTHFKKAAGYPARIEASPAYLTWSEKSAQRIKDVYGNQPVKIVAIFRDPVKRAYSHYWHRVRLGSEDGELGFTKAVRTEEQRLQEKWDYLYQKGDGLHGYKRASHYMQRLQPFLQIFPRESFHFMIQEDLFKDFDVRMAELCRFMGIDDSFKFESLNSNESAVPRYDFLGKTYKDMKSNPFTKAIFKMFFSKNARATLFKDVVMKKFEYPPIEEDVKRELYAEFAAETDELAALIGRDLSGWKLKG